MTAVQRVLRVLYECRGLYLTAGEVAARAGVEGRRVRGAVEALRERGQAVEESPAHGLRLAGSVLLDGGLIEHELGTRRVGRHVICFGEVGSTNDVAFDSARQKGSDGLAVLAESQTAGRGRQGSKWVSPSGANVLTSVLLHDPRGELSDEALTIAAGLAAAEGVERATGVSAELKWPNDLMLDEAKLGGILVEVRTRGGMAAVVRRHAPTTSVGAWRRTTAAMPLMPRQIVIGIGINVNAAPPAEVVGRAAICLAEHLGHAVERIEVAREVLRRLDHWVGQVEGGQYGELHALWRGRCGMINQRARVLSGGRTYEGRVLDVSPLEGLILAEDSGPTVHLPARTSSVVE